MGARSTGRCRDSNGSYKRGKLDLHTVGQPASWDGRLQWTDSLARTASLCGEESCSILGTQTDSEVWEKIPDSLADVLQVSSVRSDPDLSSLPETETGWEICQPVPMPQKVPQALDPQGTVYVPAYVPALVPGYVPLHADHALVAWSPGASPDD